MTDDEVSAVAAKVVTGNRILVIGIILVLMIIGSCVEEDESTPAGDDPTLRADVWCEDEIERLAQYSSRWTDGFLEPKFSRYRWENDEQTVAYVIGDRVEFQNGFGAWQPHWYTCEIDFRTDPPTIIEVNAFPGRLPSR